MFISPALDSFFDLNDNGANYLDLDGVFHSTVTSAKSQKSKSIHLFLYGYEPRLYVCLPQTIPPHKIIFYFVFDLVRLYT